MSHTPGPWKAQLEDWEYPHDIDIEIVADGTHIARVTTCWPCLEDHDAETGEANAQLIASAPDLLAACEELLAAAEITGDEVWDEDKQQPVYDNDSGWFTIALAEKIVQAVRKAKGEQA